MTHIDDGILRAYLDEELDADRLRGTSSHLAGCEACAIRLEEVERRGAFVGGALALLDATEPVRADWSALERRIARGRSSRKAFPLARAAGITLLLGGGAAAALLPGSPLRRAADPEPAAVSPARAVEVQPEAGIRPPLAVESVRFVIQAPSGTEVTVEVAPRGSGIFAHPGSTFSSAGDELRAIVSEGAVRIEVSAELVEARVEVNGREVVGLRAGRVVLAPDEAERSADPTRLRFEVS